MPRMPFDPAQVLRLAHDTLDIEAAAVLGLKRRLGDGFAVAVELMLQVTGRVVVMGRNVTVAVVDAVASGHYDVLVADGESVPYGGMGVCQGASELLRGGPGGPYRDEVGLGQPAGAVVEHLDDVRPVGGGQPFQTGDLMFDGAWSIGLAKSHGPTVIAVPAAGSS